MEHRIAETAYGRLFAGEKVLRREAETSFPGAKGEVARLVEELDKVTEAADLGTKETVIWFNKPAEQIGVGPLKVVKQVLR